MKVVMRKMMHMAMPMYEVTLYNVHCSIHMWLLNYGNALLR